MILACRDKTSARLAGTNFTLRLHGKFKSHPAKAGQGPGTCLRFLAPKLSFFDLCGIFKQHGGYQTTFDHLHDKPVKLFFSTVDEFVFFTQLYFTRAYP